MPKDELWRALVNSFDELPEDGLAAPAMEQTTPFVDVPEEPQGDQVFVQKVVTEMYIFTNSDKKVFGEHTYQDMVVLGIMPMAKLLRLLDRQKRKRNKGS